MSLSDYELYSSAWPAASHWNLHKRTNGDQSLEAFPKGYRDLDCPVCSGLPPWRWEGFVHESQIDGAPQVFATPARLRDPRVRPVPDYIKEHAERFGKMPKERGFKVEFLAFRFTKPRAWKTIPFPVGCCRICGRFGRVARHRVPLDPRYKRPTRRSPGRGVPDLEQWKKAHICRRCRRIEDRTAEGIDQSKEVARLLKELTKRRSK